MRLKDTLELKYKDKLSKSVDHKFVLELCCGSLDDAVLFVYLVQDLKFFELLLRMLARAMSLCTHSSALLTLGKQVGLLSESEATYFKLTLAGFKKDDSLQRLPPSMLKEPSETIPEVQQFLEFLEHILEKGTYVEIITACYVFELVYLMWADKHGSDEKAVSVLEYKHKEWIYLHRGVAFENWVHFLASEVARVSVEPEVEHKVEAIAAKVLDLEGQFFESCYNFNGR